MGTGKVWKLLTAGLLGLGVSAAVHATDPDTPRPAPPPPPGSTSIFTKMLHGTAKTPTAKKPPPKVEPPKPTGDPIAKARAREMANWLRRTDVCLRLMQVADETNDETLRKRAQELDRRARTAFEHRMAELGAAPGEGIDDNLLDRHLGDAEESADRAVQLMPRTRIRTANEEGSE